MNTQSGELDRRFSAPEATAMSWPVARDQLDDAKTYLLATVRPDGRPHVTTIAGVWLDDAIHFITGGSEQKAKNLAAGNSHVIVASGCNGWDGLDVVVEGDAVQLTDPDRLARLADAYTRKYDDAFRLHLEDGRLQVSGAEDESLAFEVRAMKAFGFAKGDTFGQTRWRFGPSPTQNA